MAHLITLQDLKNERLKLINSMEILPVSQLFTDEEKEDLKAIYIDTLSHYDNAIARETRVIEFTNALQ